MFLENVVSGYLIYSAVDFCCWYFDGCMGFNFVLAKFEYGK